jgi:hypothetical protein
VAEGFQYALLRAVPSIERGEALNVGVVVHCRRAGFLGVRTAVDEERLRLLDPGVDVAAVDAHLAVIERVAAGDEPENPIASMDRSDRFGWIVAPSSTSVQPSPVHTGLTDDPAATLDKLFAELVLVP